jgi:RNase P/RNase MRP subunit p30
MKRTYADLHLRANLSNREQVTRIMNKASTLGYQLIALTWLSNYNPQEEQYLQNIRSQAKIDIVSRVDIKPKTPKELTYFLRKLRRKFEIIGVICETKEVARQAAKDRRVDLLNFPSLDYRRRFFDKAEAELARKSSAFLEIDMKPLLTLEGRQRIRLLS